MPNEFVSRRELAKLVACGTGATLFGPPLTGADDETPGAPTPLDQMMALLFDRYPSEHLTEEQIAGIRRDVRRKQIQSAILRQFPLEPADSPALVFAAYRREE